MKNLKIITGIILMSVFIGCKNYNNNNSSHTHDGLEYHTHDNNNHNHDSKTIKVSDYFGDYEIEDSAYGTKTKVTIIGNQRVMITNSLPNHKTGQFPNPGNPNTISEQNKTYSFPVNPKYTGKSQWMREPGIALNGVKFEPQTAEVVVCETGENYRVEAIQNVIDLGLDLNHAHVQPTGEYHYHGTPTSMIETFDTGNDLVHIGFAHDGFPMYYSKSGKYKPSFKLLEGDREGEDCTYTTHITIDIEVKGHHDGTYGSDYEYIEGYGDLDECNGIEIDGNYMYLVTNEFPYVGRCVMGEVEQDQQGPPPSNGQGGPRGNQSDGKPNASQVMQKMDTNKDGKLTAAEIKGPLKQDFDKIDTNNDNYISKEELENLSREKKQRP
ncbi:YHYH protein [Lacinutrix sp. C3R15]|uniref:YHYH protein n=1 Tax=Flavobacteriaceae TaxID=49546 RepID=UPI001C0A556E|nr:MULTISPECIES: YHYH protein [Flavobacteriaceae]MBU2938566.1 YHYH protein [Lacinutrix sp. C3R15]MDO6621880.1 YHYH protein [Oceanihabitans sp. 1_MG-2023]